MKLLTRQLDVRSVRTRLQREWGVTILVAFAWFVLAYATIFWAEGLRPRTFMSPDEAANRFASSIINKTGHPFLDLPFPDPEDVAHPRAWLSQGDYAIPIYPPVSIYFYALLTHLRRFGSLALLFLPASAVAAFAAGAARLLPCERRWLAVFAPALGAPALYWLLRPWMNICALLTCVCWAFFCWTHWLARGSTRWLALTLLFVGLAAAVRPDYTAYLLAVTLLLGLGKRPTEWRRLLVLTFAAGALALGLNLVLNQLVTGHPFHAAYQMAMDEGSHARKTNPAVHLVKLLFFPMSFPGWGAVGEMFFRYWIGMQPMWLLLLAQLALVPLFKQQRPFERATTAVVLLLLVLFMVSRVDPHLFGANREDGMVEDSIPRYWSPVYLLAALPPLWWVGHATKRAFVAAGATALGLLAGGNLFVLGWYDMQSVVRHHTLANQELASLDALVQLVPHEAIVYSATHDKVLWSRFRVGSLEEFDKSARSMVHALDNELPVYVWLRRMSKSEQHRLERALERHDLALVTVDQSLRLHRVSRPQ